ncbi:MAG: RNA methyltransferase [Bacteroidales bacterium]|nr:RNA methyltransferase [Bacteroidales bacterium]
MLSHSQIKYIQSLQQKKFRRQYGVFVAEGEKIVSELWASNFGVEGIYALSGWLEAHRHEIRPGVDIYELSEKDLGRISGLKTPNKVMAVVKTPEPGNEPEHMAGSLSLVLDKVQDPGNLGTIIRTADWFGIRQIICSPDTAEVFSPKVVQATMGSFLRVKVSYTELEPFFEKTKAGTPVYGAFLEGENLFEVNPSGQGLMVIGNESKGISYKVATFVGKKLRIPGGRQSNSLNSAESLNASVAAGILMAWMTKK